MRSVCFRGDFAIKHTSWIPTLKRFENASHVEAFYSYAILLVADQSCYRFCTLS